MNHFYTEADAGSVLIGNDAMRYQVRNGYGDGLTHVYTDVSKADIAKLLDTHDISVWAFEGITSGTTHIYPHDCLYNHTTGELLQETPVATLEGRYAIRSGHGLHMRHGVVLFIKLD